MAAPSPPGARSRLDEDSKDMLLVKIVFVGDSSVGKTSLIHRLFNNEFDDQIAATIGCDFKYKKYLFDGRSVGVTVWDTAGSERFASVTSSYYRGAQGVVFVYDVTRRETFDRLQHWLSEVSRVGSHPDTIRLIVGNKTDLVAPVTAIPAPSPSAAVDTASNHSRPPPPYESQSLHPPLSSSDLPASGVPPVSTAQRAVGVGGTGTGAASTSGTAGQDGVQSTGSGSGFGGGRTGEREREEAGCSTPKGPREVSAEEAAAFARANGCLYQETSARLDTNVHDALAWGLICAIVDTPSLHRTQAPTVLESSFQRPEQQQKQRRQQHNGLCGGC